MITEFFLDLLFGVVEGLCSLMPEIYWTVDTGAFSYAHDALSMVCYLLPMGTVTNIVSLLIAILFLRIAIAFIRTILGLIPFV